MKESLHALNSASLFIPLTYSLYKWSDGKNIHRQRTGMVCVYFARPIDRVIQTFSCLIFSVGQHFHDLHLLRKRKDYKNFSWQLAISPVWLVLKTAAKTSIFALVSLRDLLVDDLFNVSEAIERVSRPQGVIDEFWLVRDFDEREMKNQGENVWSFSHYETRSLQKMPLSERAKNLSDKQQSRDKEKIDAVYKL